MGASAGEEQMLGSFFILLRAVPITRNILTIYIKHFTIYLTVTTPPLMSNVSSMSRLAPGKENMLVLGRMMKESGTYLDDMASKTPTTVRNQPGLQENCLKFILVLSWKKKFAFAGFYKMAEE